MNAERLALTLRLMGIGWYVATCIGGGTYGGFLLDRRFELSPLLTLLGLGLGIAVAVIGMVRMIQSLFAEDSGAEKPDAENSDD